MFRTIIAALCSLFLRHGFSLFTAALLCLATTAVAQTTWTVNSTGDSGTGSGSSGDLRYALSHSGSGDIIEFSVTGTITLTSTLPGINQNLTIQGPGASQLTISGNSLYQVFAINSGTVTISGLTVSHGAGSGSGNTFGGGLINYNGNVTLTGCAFSFNTATFGGAIQNQSYMTIVDSTFLDNAANGSAGGAIQSTGTDPSSFVVSHSTFSGNSASSSGGAIFLATGTISNSTFISNQAQYGGAIDGSANVSGSTFIGNSASSDGGAMNVNGGTILNSTFAFNSSGNYGGAVWAVGYTVTHSTFSANSSADGGAITSVNSLTANNNIFEGNAADNDSVIGNNGGTVDANYNVLWNNVDYYGGGVDCGSCTMNASTYASADPLLPLNSYGGITKTFMPTASSAAICNGSATLAVDANNHALTTDQRGFPFNYNYCTNGGVDAGSVQSNYQVVTTAADSNDGACTTSLCSLRDAVAAAENAGGGDVGFSSSLNNQTIALGSGLELSGAIGVVGPGANLLGVSGNPSLAFNVFQVDSGAQAFLYGLTIENGGASSSGGISNAGTLTISSSTISGNQSGQFGAGIYNTGSLYVLDSSIVNNKGKYGGAIGNNGGTTVLVESTLSGNQGDFYGGGVFNEAGSVTTQNVTIAGNWGGLGGPGVYNHSGATVTSANSIITGNELGASSSPGDYLDITAASGFVDDGGNVIGYANTSNAAAPSSAHTLAGLGYYANSVLETMLPWPGSPAICAGLVANLPPDIQTDERGFPNYNTTYAGFTSGSRCVDAGAVQTNYTSVQFVQQPADVAVNTLISPAPTVKLIETNANTNQTDIPAIAVLIALTYSGGAGAINGTLTQPVSAGVATYSDLVPIASLHDVTLAAGVPVTTAGSGTTLTATSSSFNVVGPLAGYAVTAPATAFDGTAFNFTVTAVDANGSELLGATDPVEFSSTDNSALLPGQSSLTGTSGTFPATLNTSGYQTITVTDASNPSVSSNSNAIAASGQATQLVVSGYPASVSQGASNSGTVTALDASGFTATFLNGFVTVTTSDSGAIVSTPVTMVNGVGAFTATFFTAGTQSIAASATGTTSIPETGITVTALPIYVVNSTGDVASGNGANCPVGGSATTCTLRDAIAALTSAGAGQITFDPTVFLASNLATANSIYLTNGIIALPSGAFLNGLTSVGSNLVTIDGGGTTAIFSVASGNSVNMANLNFAHGKSNSGSVVQTAGALTVSNCTFSNNAGQVIWSTGSLVVTGSAFANNATTGPGRPSGEAILSPSGSATIVNSSFLNNTAATGGGGAVDATGSSLTVTGSSFSGNSSYIGGGAIYSRTTNPTIIVDSTFTGNSANINGGGAIYAYDTDLEIYSSTIAGNSAEGQGGGISQYNLSGSPKLTLTNSIVGGNTATGYGVDIYGSYTDGGGNLASNNTSGTSTINPMLAPLGNYGGPTQTMVPLPGSPAICAGSQNAIFSGRTIDQRGFPNTNIAYPGFDSGTPCVDVGAVQTNYTIGFTTQPPPSGSVGVALNPAPVVSLNESGTPVALNAGALSMTDSSNLLTGTLSETFASGAASFDNLAISAPTTGDKLNATLALTPSIYLTAKSSVGVTVTSPLPWVHLSSTNLSYGSREVGVVSPSQSVTLTNIGETSLSISSIAVTGNDASSFVFANSCGASLAAGTSCTIHGHFTPTRIGPFSAALTITDSSAGGPASISLSGTGQTGPPLPLTAVSLSYGNQVVGTTSASQSVTMTNTSGSPISISSITVTGANASSFIFANSCGTGLAVGTSCTIHGHFTPTTSGPLSAALIITDNNPSGGTESISLSGTGVTPPAVSLSSTSLSYGNKLVGATSASQSVTLTNTGGLPLLISSIAVTGPDASSFIVANSCGTSVAAGASCTIHGHFTPTTTGPLTAAVTITDNASDSPQSVSLSGTGR